MTGLEETLLIDRIAARVRFGSDRSVSFMRTKMDLKDRTCTLYQLDFFYLLMIASDPRYATILPMVKEGRIKTFRDIFKFIPRTVVARDLGKHVARLSVRLKHLENFTVGELFIIGNLCNLSRTEVLDLVKMEFTLADHS